MKRLLFLLFILSTISNYGQSLSKTSIIYESKGQIVMNNGKQYELIEEKPFYEVNDYTIKKHLQVNDDLLRLNRVLILKNDNKMVTLVEWLKEDFRYYEYRKTNALKNNNRNISNSY